MLTEWIGFFIVVLVMVFVIVRRQMLKGKLSQEDFDDSADRLQLRLEDAADHIIERMKDHIDQLELLLGEADEKIALLDSRIEQLKILSEKDNVRSVENPDSASNEENRRVPKVACIKKFPLVESDKSIGNGIRGKKKIELKPSKMNQAVLEMLKNGYTIEEISKKMGIGRGAILLIQEMYGSAQT